MQRKPPEKPDLSEKGAPIDGKPQSSDRRLFIQLLVFDGCTDLKPLIAALKQAQIMGALYEDLHAPRGIGILTIAESPDFFVTQLRTILNKEPFIQLTPRPGFTMFGRTYSLGYEPDLDEVLRTRPIGRALNRDWPWVVWYPLRRSGAFARLKPEEQRDILKEHGQIGFAFGAADYAHDIRLACYGLDTNDNDFVIGLIGKALFPLSAIVQTMRKTIQTSQYIEKLGPFFIGKVAWQSDNSSI